jgi:hypothetical protein
MIKAITAFIPPKPVFISVKQTSTIYYAFKKAVLSITMAWF